jgi:hypothetical protein
LIALIAFAGSVGAAPPAKRETVLTVDNFGGFSHLGRRVVVFADGGCADATYTDVQGHETSRACSCTLDRRAGRLTLDGSERLLRIEHQGQDYWVHEDDAERIKRPGEDYLRQTSLRNAR